MFVRRLWMGKKLKHRKEDSEYFTGLQDEFNLSERIFIPKKARAHMDVESICVENVKEFIRLLKEYIEQGGKFIGSEINKLAGEKLAS